VGSLFGTVWDAVQIASDGHERVLVTWPARDGIEARWLRVETDRSLRNSPEPAYSVTNNKNDHLEEAP
jgi:hypothetical protein